MGTFVRYILVLIEVVVSLLLIGVILMQRAKSQGLGMALGGQMGEALFGARMGNVMTRVTVILGIIFLVNTTLLAYIGATNRRVSVTDDAVAPVPVAPAAPAAPMAAPGGVVPTDMPAAEADAMAPATPTPPAAVPVPTEPTAAVDE